MIGRHTNDNEIVDNSLKPRTMIEQMDSARMKDQTVGYEMAQVLLQSDDW